MRTTVKSLVTLSQLGSPLVSLFFLCCSVFSCVGNPGQSGSSFYGFSVSRLTYTQQWLQHSVHLGQHGAESLELCQVSTITTPPTSAVIGVVECADKTKYNLTVISLQKLFKGVYTVPSGGREWMCYPEFVLYEAIDNSTLLGGTDSLYATNAIVTKCLEGSMPLLGIAPFPGICVSNKTASNWLYTPPKVRRSKRAASTILFAGVGAVLFTIVGSLAAAGTVLGAQAHYALADTQRAVAGDLSAVWAAVNALNSQLLENGLISQGICEFLKDGGCHFNRTAMLSIEYRGSSVYRLALGLNKTVEDLNVALDVIRETEIVFPAFPSFPGWVYDYIWYIAFAVGVLIVISIFSTFYRVVCTRACRQDMSAA